MEINHVCSLGSSCHTSFFLKRNKLKVVSYPFDRIVSNYMMVQHCIEDEFRTFLDKSYYVMTNNETRCRHTYYKEDVFYHHNPLKNKTHYEYYVRCVNRFMELLSYPNHKMFMIMFPNMTKDEIFSNQLKEYMMEFNKTLSKNTRNYTLLVIFHYSNREENLHSFEERNGLENDSRIHFLEIHTMTRSNGTIFENLNDNICFRNIIRGKYMFRIQSV